MRFFRDSELEEATRQIGVPWDESDGLPRFRNAFPRRIWCLVDTSIRLLRWSIPGRYPARTQHVPKTYPAGTQQVPGNVPGIRSNWVRCEPDWVCLWKRDPLSCKRLRRESGWRNIPENFPKTYPTTQSGHSQAKKQWTRTPRRAS